MSEISEHIMHMRVAQAEISRLRAELEEWKLQSARKRATAHEAKDYEAAISVWKCRAEEAERQLAEARAEVERLTERLQANAAKIDEEDVVIEWADYLELKAEARKEAAREVMDGLV